MAKALTIDEPHMPSGSPMFPSRCRRPRAQLGSSSDTMLDAALYRDDGAVPAVVCDAKDALDAADGACWYGERAAGGCCLSVGCGCFEDEASEEVERDAGPCGCALRLSSRFATLETLTALGPSASSLTCGIDGTAEAAAALVLL